MLQIVASLTDDSKGIFMIIKFYNTDHKLWV